jgi:hypothetical protein
MKNIIVFSITLLSCFSVYAEKLMDVSLSGSFYASTKHMIASGNNRSAFIYSVLGASILSDNKGNNYSVSIECLGFDELGEKLGTQGTGRCIWKDSDNDHIYVTVSTAGEKNRYNITSGTGKWLNASGQIDTDFVYLPAPTDSEFLGTDAGKGKISYPINNK